MRLFFSWQSDIPENKKLLRKILQEVCKDLNIEYTDDTRDETGGGHVVDALLRKIENSHIFVGDITIIGQAINSDKLINSNVAYELGYAEAKLTRASLLLVMNEEYGTYEDMPFDLGKRIITRFRTVDSSLSPEELKGLKSELKRKIYTLSLMKGDGGNTQAGLNTSEKTLLYFALREGRGRITDGNALDKGRMPTIMGTSGIWAGGAGWGRLLHDVNDFKNETRLRSAIETLVSKKLLLQADPLTWVLSDEGEVAAGLVTEGEVYTASIYKQS